MCNNNNYGPPGKFVFFRKIWKFGKNRINSKTFFFFARFEKVRSSSNKSSNFFWRKVRTKFEQSSNELRRNSSNSSIQVSPRCFVFRRCLFMIYQNTNNINEAFNRNGQSAAFCDRFLCFSHKTTLCCLIKDYHIRTIEDSYSGYGIWDTNGDKAIWLAKPAGHDCRLTHWVENSSWHFSPILLWHFFRDTSWWFHSERHSWCLYYTVVSLFKPLVVRLWSCYYFKQ
jgi:hypothetical protein